MNYLSELLAFYDRLELNPLPSPAIALWHALMSIANKTGWQQEFTVAVSVLMLKSGLNAQAIKRARNRLEQDGYITWKSRGGNQSAVYHINSLVVQNNIKNVPQYEPQSVPQTDPQSVPQCEPQSVPINKQKQNETKNTPPISPVTRMQDFIAAYPGKANVYQVEIAYADLVKSGIVTEDDLVSAAKNYADECSQNETESKYIKRAENFLRETMFDYYLPGKYKKPAPQKKKGADQYNQFMKREIDMDDLEKQLLGG